MAASTPDAVILPPLIQGDLQLTKSGFNPTVDDVIEVRRIFTTLGVGNLTVPMEIAVMILALAAYYPRQSSHKQEQINYKANEFWSLRGSIPEASVAGIYLAISTLSIPRTIARPKSITFQMKSADQGWADNGGHGTYENSHSWYEASIARPRPEASTVEALLNTNGRNFRVPEEARDYFGSHGWDMVERNDSVVWKVHNNITACMKYRHYTVEWVAGIPTEVGDPRAMGDGEGFLGLLQPDDLVILWARAEEQSWTVNPQQATIEIEYEVL
ncbi:hypothetical protein GGS24DRAFT_465714 [Hypoxylon argillaceum]|nr:hypothetical protein GGS24DRAFT_465714 [Hypoxylon argillaceum]